jgi:phosphatidylserine/phosphatidylglycerophosphate/cardiolipin synthase-like enzyme
MIFFDSDYAKELNKKVSSTTTSIDVCMYVWRWAPNDPTADVQKLYVSLLSAAARGVRVRVLSHFPENTAKMRFDGLDAVTVPANRILHAKMFIIDGSSVFLGSHNMTVRSTTSNHEVSAELDDYESVQQAIRYFNAIWGNYASSKAGI